MWDDVVLIVVGLAVLLAGGDLLVRGAVGVAKKLGVSPLVISLTIVAFGTSAPELFVAVQSVLEHTPGIALGTIVGANVANILLVLGLPAVLYPVSAQAKGLRAHGGALLAAGALFAAVAYFTGAIGRLTGLLLIAGIVAYALFMAARVKREGSDPAVYDPEEFGASAPLARTLVSLVAGLVALPLGAHLVVANAGDFAAGLGIREAAAALTLVAFGTTLPELATGLAAAAHRKTEVAIGDIVGSSVFNLLAVGGAAGLAGGAAFDDMAMRLDIPAMLLAIFLLCAFVFLKKDIGRVWGFVMTAAYAGFVAVVAMTAGATP
jgi:cation:H+ antiporter